MRNISPDVLDVLRNCTADGALVFLPPEQLERKLYQNVDKVLKAFGGTWVRKLGAHEFPADFDAAQMLAETVANGHYVDPRRELGYFPTPADLAVQAADLIGCAGCRVLEPQAGDGALVDAALAAGAREVVAIEIDPSRARRLQEKYVDHPVTVVADDFLTCPDLPVLAGAGFDRVLMNPPFGRLQELEHVRRAHACLTPGGRLATILPLSYTFHSTAKAKQFRDWLTPFVTETIEVPAGAFRASGTMIPTLLLALQA